MITLNRFTAELVRQAALNSPAARGPLLDAPRRAARVANPTSSRAAAPIVAVGGTRKVGRSGTSSNPQRFAAFADASNEGAAELQAQATEAAHPAAPGHRVAMMRREFAASGGRIAKAPKEHGAAAVDMARRLGVIR